MDIIQTDDVVVDPAQSKIYTDFIVLEFNTFRLDPHEDEDPMGTEDDHRHEEERNKSISIGHSTTDQLI